MKRIFTLSALAFSILFFAQEAGKKGELLKNEASTTEMQKRVDTGHRPVEQNSKNSIGQRDYGNSSKNNSNSGMQQNSYRWNQNYGYSEVFLRIPENGYFSVAVGDQMISNGSGKYRFFDLSSGRIPLSIYSNGYLIYKTQLRVSNNSRMVLDFFTNKGLYLLDTYPVHGQMYGFNEWDDVWNNPYNSGWNNHQQNGIGYADVMDNYSFSQFLNALNRNASFDKNKKEFILQQLRNTKFTSAQVASMLKSFSFDKGRLEMAKILYKSCVDKYNFYQVADIFDFESSKRDLMNFIRNS